MSEANVYSIINNPLLQDPTVIQAAVDNIQSTLATLTEYTPAEVNTFVDWSYDAGDIVTLVNDASDYVMPIFNSIVNWNGAGDVTWTNSGNEARELPTVTQRQTYAHGTAIHGLEDAAEQFTTDIQQTNTYISLIATETDVETAQTLGQSLFQITSGQISSLVTKVGAVPDGSNLYSLYQQEAGKIELVVGTNQGTNYIKAASIVTEINAQSGQGQVRINADQITIDGSTAFYGDVTIDGSTYNCLKAPYIYCSNEMFFNHLEGDGILAREIEVSYNFNVASDANATFYCDVTCDEDVKMYNTDEDLISVPVHLHKLSITEATSGGTPTGEITVTIGEMTNTASEATRNFDMADTDWYADRVSEFNQEIADAYAEGHSDGYSDGYSEGYADGYADGGGGGGTVVTYVPQGATVEMYTQASGYTFEWMPCQYNGNTGYIMSKFIQNTGAYNNSSGTAQLPGSVTTSPSSYRYNGTIDTSVHGTGGRVALRSSPST